MSTAGIRSVCSKFAIRIVGSQEIKWEQLFCCCPSLGHFGAPKINSSGSTLTFCQGVNQAVARERLSPLLRVGLGSSLLELCKSYGSTQKSLQCHSDNARSINSKEDATIQRVTKMAAIRLIATSSGFGGVRAYETHGMQVRRFATKGIVKVHIALTPKRWKREIPSTEVVNAVFRLRQAQASRNRDIIKLVLKKEVGRLLKLELLQVLAELQRVDETALAVEVFNMMKAESWYKPDLYVYQTMVQTAGRTRHIHHVEKMWKELHDVGLEPNGSIQRELLRAYLLCGMASHAINVYKEILKSGQDQAARSMLFHGLNDDDKAAVVSYEKESEIDWS